MKSVSQKQQEAIERKRKFFIVHINYWIEWSNKALLVSKTSTDPKDLLILARAKQAEAALCKHAKEAKVDRYGNPI